VPGLSAGPLGFSLAGQRSLAGCLLAAGRSPWLLDIQYSAWKRQAQDFDCALACLRSAVEFLEQRGECEAGKLDGIGHSLGGLLLLALAAGGTPLRSVATLASALDYRHGRSSWAPVRSLAALGRALQPRAPRGLTGLPVELLGSLAAPLFGRRLPLPFEHLNFHPGSTDGPAIRKVVALGMRDLPLSLLLSLSGLLDDGGLIFGSPPAPLHERVAQLEIPVLLVAGLQDLQCSPEAVRAARDAIPGAQLLEVGAEEAGQGFGHYDLLTGRRASEAVFGPLARWLGEVSAEAA